MSTTADITTRSSITLRWPSLVQSAYIGLFPVRFYEHVRRLHPDAVCTHIAPLPPAVMVYAPPLVKAFFSLSPQSFSGGEGNRLLRPIVGDTSVIVSDGAWHQRQQRLLRPAFSADRLRPFNERMGAITAAILSAAPQNTPLPFIAITQKISLYIIIELLFGSGAPEQYSMLATHISDYVRLSNAWPLLVPALQHAVGNWSPWTRIVHKRNQADQLLYAIIRERRARSEQSTDLLSALLVARDEDGSGFTDREIRDALVSLLIAGHETTATSLAWTIDFLAHHPDWQNRARDEALKTTQGDEPAAKCWPLLDAILKESLRLRPVLSNVRRLATSPLQVGPYAIQPGESVAACAYLAHTDARTYATPYTFMPQRWENKRPDPSAFFPFGGGARHCIGAYLAMHEMTIVLVHMLNSAEYLPATPKPARIVRTGISFAPAKGGPIIIRGRKTAC